MIWYENDKKSANKAYPKKSAVGTGYTIARGFNPWN